MTNDNRDMIEGRGILAHPLEGEPWFHRSPSNSPFVPSFPSAAEDER